MKKITTPVLHLPDPTPYKVISFDIFDTSVLRLVFEPRDIFLIMEEELVEAQGRLFLGFADLRFQAELETVSKVWALDRSAEANLDDIYETLFILKPVFKPFSLALKEMELRIERSFTIPNRQILDYYNSLLQLQKTLIFVSDTYFPKDYITRVLEGCGYRGYERLFVSCEVGTNKASGRLFDVVIQELEVEPKHILHIGDNQHADITQAAAWGINTCKIPYSGDLLHPTRYQHEKYKHYCFRETASGTLLRGIQKNYLMNGSFGMQAETKPGYDIGYQILGPLMYGFANWLLQHAQQKNIKQLYFIAREGWFLKQVFDEINLVAETNIVSNYLYASRRALFFPFLEGSVSEYLFSFMMSTKPTKIGDYIKALELKISDQRLRELGYGSREELVDFFSPSDQAKVKAFFEAEADQLVRLAKEEKLNYLEYLQQVGMLSSSNIGVVDSGWFGNGQKRLRNFLEEANPDSHLFGFYMALHERAKKNFGDNSSGYGYLYHLDGFNNDSEAFLEVARILEVFLSAPSESLKRMTKENGVIRPVFMKETINTQLHPTIENMHKGALDFVREFAGVPSKQMPTLPSYLLANLLREFINTPTKEEALYIGMLPYESNVIGDDEAKFSFPKVQVKDFLQDPFSLDREFKRTLWRSAYFENHRSSILKFVLRYTQPYFLKQGKYSRTLYELLRKMQKVRRIVKREKTHLRRNK